MRIKLVKVGNSWGIRLPHTIVRECELGEEVDLDIRNKHIILTAIPAARKGWAESVEDELNGAPLQEQGEWQW